LAHARERNALACAIYTPFLDQRFDLYDTFLSGALVVPKFTQYSDVSVPFWEKGTIATDLRKAKRMGLMISTDVTPERVEAFFSIYSKNCADYGIPLKPRACIEFLMDEGVRSGRVGAYFCFQNGQTIAGLLVTWSKLVTSYYLPCALEEARTFQPGTALIERAMNDSIARGIRVWNWESSPSRESGVYRFKKKWDAVEALYRIYVLLLGNHETLRRLGVDGIRSNFPYFYVYPFEQIGNEQGC
jgi:hypothetical protein